MASQNQLDLRVKRVPVGARFFRIMAGHHADPLGCVASLSRFCDPRLARSGKARYRTLYLASTFEVAFVETMIRDTTNNRAGDIPISLADLNARKCAVVETSRDLVLADLTRGGALTMGVPTDTAQARNHAAGRTFSEKAWNHTDAVDGIYYASRLNGDHCLALFCRCFDDGAIVPTGLHAPLMHWPAEMAHILDKYGLSVV